MHWSGRRCCSPLRSPADKVAAAREVGAAEPVLRPLAQMAARARARARARAARARAAAARARAAAARAKVAVMATPRFVGKKA